MARRLTLHGTHSMHRITAFEQLKITRVQRKAADQVRTAADQHGPNVVKIFCLCRSNVRAVLEDATSLRLLREQAHSELICVEVPRMLHPCGKDVEAQPGQGVRELVDAGQLEAA